MILTSPISIGDVSTEYITHIYTFKNRVRSARKMMEFTQNYWGQRDTIIKIIILTNQGTYMIHDVILTKGQKYPSTTKLKYATFLDKVNKPSWGHLNNMTAHDAYSIKILVHTLTPSEISHKQKW